MARYASVALLALVDVAVVLNPSDAKAGHPAAVDRALPTGKFFQAQLIALAGLIDSQEPARNGGNHLRLAADDPASRSCRRQ